MNLALFVAFVVCLSGVNSIFIEGEQTDPNADGAPEVAMTSSNLLELSLSCSQKIDQCSEQYTNLSQPFVDDMEIYYNCLMQATGCSPEEEEARNELAAEVLATLKQLCPSCDPAVGSALPTSLQATTHTACHDQIVQCTNTFNDSFSSPGAIKDYYFCLLGPMDCDVWEENTRQQLLAELEPLCPECDPGLETATSKGIEGPTCLESILLCADSFNYSNAEHKAMREYYDCLFPIKDCEEWEEATRQKLMENLILMMSTVCPQCDNPTLSPPTPEPEVEPEMKPEPGSITCYDRIIDCSNHFKDTPQTDEDMELYYKCLVEPQDCQAWEDEDRQNRINEILEKCPSCVPPQGGGVSPLPVTGGCYSHLMQCYSDFNYTQKTIRDYEKAYACVVQPPACEPWETEVQTQLLTLILEGCPSCEGGNTVIHPTDSSGKELSCYEYTIVCQNQFDRSKHQTEDMKDFLDCLEIPQNCLAWEDSIREDMKSTIRDLLNQPTQTPTTAPDCYNHLMMCFSDFNTTEKKIRDYETAFTCVNQPENCQQWEEDVRHQLLDIFLHECPTCEGGYSAPHPTDPTGNELSCHDFTMMCYKQFNESKQQEDDVEEYFNCLEIPQNCLAWEEDVREEMKKAVSDMTREATTSKPDMQSPTPDPADCNDYLLMCYGNFNASEMRLRDYETAYSCVHVPEECEPWEEEFRSHLLDLILGACPTCKGGYSAPQPTDENGEELCCYEFTMLCHRKYNMSTQLPDDIVDFYHCLDIPENCLTWEEDLRHQMQKDLVESLKKACPSCDLSFAEDLDQKDKDEEEEEDKDDEEDEEEPNILPNIGPEPEPTCFEFLQACHEAFDASRYLESDMARMYECLQAASVLECAAWERDFQTESIANVQRLISQSCPDCHVDTTMAPYPDKGAVTHTCRNHFEMCRQQYERSLGDKPYLSQYDSCLWLPYDCKPEEENVRRVISAAIEDAIKADDYARLTQAAMAVKSTSLLVLMTPLLLLLW